jgi:hypothetical protein
MTTPTELSTSTSLTRSTTFKRKLRQRCTLQHARASVRVCVPLKFTAQRSHVSPVDTTKPLLGHSTSALGLSVRLSSGSSAAQRFRSGLWPASVPPTSQPQLAPRVAIRVAQHALGGSRPRRQAPPPVVRCSQHEAPPACSEPPAGVQTPPSMRSSPNIARAPCEQRCSSVREARGEQTSMQRKS